MSERKRPTTKDEEKMRLVCLEARTLMRALADNGGAVLLRFPIAVNESADRLMARLVEAGFAP